MGKGHILTPLERIEYIEKTAEAGGSGSAEVVIKDIAVPVMADSWMYNDTLEAFAQTVLIKGLTETANPIILLSSINEQASKEELDAYLCIKEANINEGSITFVADEKPAISITLIVKNVVASDSTTVDDITALVNKVNELESEINTTNEKIAEDIATSRKYYKEPADIEGIDPGTVTLEDIIASMELSSSVSFWINQYDEGYKTVRQQISDAVCAIDNTIADSTVFGVVTIEKSIYDMAIIEFQHYAKSKWHYRCCHYRNAHTGELELSPWVKIANKNDFTGAISTVLTDNLVPYSVTVANNEGKLASSSVNPNELSYLKDVNENIQTQFNNITKLQTLEEFILTPATSDTPGINHGIYNPMTREVTVSYTCSYNTTPLTGVVNIATIPEKYRPRSIRYGTGALKNTSDLANVLSNTTCVFDILSNGQIRQRLTSMSYNQVFFSISYYI